MRDSSPSPWLVNLDIHLGSHPVIDHLVFHLDGIQIVAGQQNADSMITRWQYPVLILPIVANTPKGRMAT